MERASLYLSLFLTGVFCLVSAAAGPAADLRPARPSGPTQQVVPVRPRAPVAVQPVQAVDLMVVPGSLKWRTPPVAGRPSPDGSFQYTVQNLGGAPASPVVRITCTGLAGGPSCPRQMTGATSLGQMDGAGGMNAQQTDLWPPPGGTEAWQAGSYEIRVQAAAGRGVGEPNTANNTEALRFTVAGLKGAPGRVSGVRVQTPVEARGINPQPEPPRVRDLRSASLPRPAPPSGPAGINPQPEPPMPAAIPVLASRFRQEKGASDDPITELRRVPGLADLMERVGAELGAADRTMNRAEIFSKSNRPMHQEGIDLRRQLESHQARLQDLKGELEKWEEDLQTVGDDAQLANIDLQNTLQKQQQMVQMLSNIAKVLHDTAMAVIRKIG